MPKAKGGLYWPGPGDHRDHTKHIDSNDQKKTEIVQDFVERLRLPLSVRTAKERMRGSLLWDITEFGRAVHAEMEALLSCQRNSISARNGTLYTTTFPCHNCTRHIVATGIRRVVYIEPYAKSRAEDLHSDDILVEDGHITDPNDERVIFEAFVGVGPRRYSDLFSMILNNGDEIARKQNGRTVEWNEYGQSPRVPLPPASYLKREELAVKEISATIKRTAKAKQ